MKRHYGGARFTSDRDTLARLLLTSNPNISDIDKIYPGQIIMLPDIAGGSTPCSQGPPVVRAEVARAYVPLREGLSRTGEVAKELMGDIDYYGVAEGIGSTFIELVDKAMANSIPEIKKIALDYYRKEAGTISENQRKYRRSKAVANVRHRLGPLHQLINPGRQPGQVLRIRPHAPIPTHQVLREANTFERIGKLASRGIVVLKAAEIVRTGVAIHTASSNTERTDLLIDAVSGLGGPALAAGVLVCCFGTPVGWVAVVAMTTAAAVGGGMLGGIGAEQFKKHTLYDPAGNRINTRADRLWNKLY
jgi:hypothetical protein